MKNHLRRAGGLVMALAMTAGLLSGCGTDIDPVQDIMGYSGSTVMFTVDGRDVTAEEYLFWLANQADSASSYLSMMAEEGTDIWETEVSDGVTAGESIKESAQQYAVMYNVVAAKGEEEGYTYTSEDKSAYKTDLEEAKESMASDEGDDTSGDEAFLNYLKSMCISEKGFETLSSVSYIHNHMVEGMFQEGKEGAPTAEDLTQYAEDNGYLVAKHILLLTIDQSTNEALSDDEIAAQKAKAEDLLAQLQAVTDPAQLEDTFDELMNANSEDTGLAENPDGYAFTSGQMVTAFEEATEALEPGEISGIVESDYGYHIILRLDPGTSAALRSVYSEEKVGELEQEWVDAAEIVTTETYDNLSVSDFYEKLTAYRNTLNETEEEDTQETDAAESETGESTDTTGDAATEDTGDTTGDTTTEDTGDTATEDTEDAAGETETSDTGEDTGEAET